MTYLEFTQEAINQAQGVKLTLTKDEMQFAYIAYTNFNISILDALVLTYELKTK